MLSTKDPGMNKIQIRNENVEKLINKKMKKIIYNYYRGRKSWYCYHNTRQIEL